MDRIRVLQEIRIYWLRSEKVDERFGWGWLNAAEVAEWLGLSERPTRKPRLRLRLALVRRVCLVVHAATALGVSWTSKPSLTSWLHPRPERFPADQAERDGRSKKATGQFQGGSSFALCQATGEGSPASLAEAENVPVGGATPDRQGPWQEQITPLPAGAGRIGRRAGRKLLRDSWAPPIEAARRQ